MATVEASDVRVTVDKKSDWGSGYDACFVLTNGNAYDVLAWTLTFDMESPFAWLGDGDARRDGSRVTLTPKEFKRVLPAGSTTTLAFGGSKHLPRNVRFHQRLPLVGADPTDKTRGAWGPKAVAPYCDACAYPTPDLAAIMRGSGVRFFTLGFVTAGADGQPAWGGSVPMSSQLLLDGVREVRGAGGDVAVSFGGASGVDLAQAAPDPDRLAAAYAKVVDTYSLRRVDMDVEGAALGDAASVERRNLALAALGRRYPALQITYCLPVLPTGLTAAGERVLAGAKAAGVRLAGVHAMAMDYGDGAAPAPDGRMGQYAIQATQAVRAQAAAAGYGDVGIGVIPMIGLNDVPGEVFRLEDARRVRAHFAATPWMTYLGWWSVNRDRPGKGAVTCSDSGLPDHRAWDFARAFLGKAPAK